MDCPHVVDATHRPQISMNEFGVWVARLYQADAVSRFYVYCYFHNHTLPPRQGVVKFLGGKICDRSLVVRSSIGKSTGLARTPPTVHPRKNDRKSLLPQGREEYASSSPKSGVGVR